MSVISLFGGVLVLKNCWSKGAGFLSIFMAVPGIFYGAYMIYAGCNPVCYVLM
jgi:hypothetical protein